MIRDVFRSEIMCVEQVNGKNAYGLMLFTLVFLGLDFLVIFPSRIIDIQRFSVQHS